ncbi:PREDICTED: scarecrow-like protein 18 [Camelina sativa]|uniref:Scarecrow-like protein 18 n=1 Tax=Camelina sativa TaxID=90675 RepID=A0ABM0X3L7_CAMSA|nr:PREDICTED: scarecrow-like protein 18 [Camelina sativa]
MLTSFKSSSSSSEDATATTTTENPPPFCQLASSSSSASTSASHHLRRLLFTAADFVSQSNFTAAQNLLSILSLNSSPYGDSTERLVHLFTKALSVRINRLQQEQDPTAEAAATCTANEMTMGNNSSTVFTSSVCKEQFLFRTKNNNSDFESCYYLWLNQLTPFIRFGHLTANQAILDATETNDNGALHILDLDISQGLQWPPLMQALAERSSNPNSPRPSLRITGCGRDVAGLNRTGDRLTRFANSLGLQFQFHTLVIVEEDIAGLLLQIRLLALSFVHGETIAVNCVHFLHKFFNDDGDMIGHFLSVIKSLNPRIVTMAEREANHGDHSFLNRFSEAVDHYVAIFDSLEATLPPNSRERLTLEQRWFGKEIFDVVAAEARERKQRHRRFEIWEEMMKRFGFVNVPIGSFALSQAKLLLRLHYPSEGYNLQFLNNSLFLGWQNRLLFSVSSWK